MKLICKSLGRSTLARRHSDVLIAVLYSWRLYLQRRHRLEARLFKFADAFREKEAGCGSLLQRPARRVVDDKLFCRKNVLRRMPLAVDTRKHLRVVHARAEGVDKAERGGALTLPRASTVVIMVV